MSPRDKSIIVENLSKCYRIGLQENMHDNILSAICDFIKRPLANYRKYRSLYRFHDIEANEIVDGTNTPSDIIWALRNVSFEINKGEVVGIIGSNGAGKSTLLKILSKITSPTIGRAQINGRISSLLEVGTGFHPELTGRENIYLNATILGMRKKEVDRKFDAIVGFSGVEKFIDTPVKRYSSGMTVRLAFSVAAHLEPEIMIIDEVLSVGDAAFQEKCIRKMREVAGEGRTVLFVSHNMAAVTQLCERAIWLKDGRIKMVGPASDMVSMYLSDSGGPGQVTWHKQADFGSDKEVQLESVRLLSAESQAVSMIGFGDPFKVEIRYEVIELIRDLSITVQVFNSQGTMVFESMNTDLPEWRGYTQKPDHYLAVCSGPEHLLKPDRYHLSVISFLMNVKVIERLEKILSFDISDVGYYPDGRYGIVSPLLHWEIKRIHHAPVTQKDLSAI